ncbi:MAG TPA: L-threonylcarbamoyladenylate synthase [Candidatus Nanoarchaeia archaeon]|nr:L-threonylcarbamoyladenylate synthase [Candidatus Nanoarchaeia archaeon]
MDFLSPEEFRVQETRRLTQIADGALFIYPTDTIYGIGCDATNQIAVMKIRELKQRPDNPFSIIAPNKAWIPQHCHLTPLATEWLAKLPGPYTLILEKHRDAVAPAVTAKPTLGIRIPNHWIAEIAEKLGKPIVTTSVNISGQESLTDLQQLPQSFKTTLAFAIDEGPLRGMPSRVIDVSSDEVRVLR